MSKIVNSVKNNVAAISIRVSDMGSTRDEKISPEMQLEMGREYAERHGLTFSEEVSTECQDLDISAYKGDWKVTRRGIQQLLTKVREGEIKHVLFYKVSRLGRNTFQGMEIAKNFIEAGATIHFIKDNLPPLESSVGQVMLSIMLSMAQEESKSKSDFVSDSIRRKQLKGEFFGVLPSWIIKGSGKGEFELCPVNAPKYRLICDLALQGKSAHAITNHLNANEIKTPKGVYWRVSKINELLHPQYIDRMAGYAYAKIDGELKNIGKIFPTLITEEEKETIKLIKKRHDGGKRTRSEKVTYISSGVVKCIYCGATMVIGLNRMYEGKSLPSFKCAYGATSHPAHKENSSNYVQTDMLDDAIARLAKHALLMPPISEKKELVKVQNNLENELKDVDEQLALLLDLYLDKKVPRDIYNNRHDSLTKEKAKLEKAISEQGIEKIPAVVGGMEDEIAALNIAAKNLLTDVKFPVMRTLRVSSKVREYRCVQATVKTTGKTYLAPVFRYRYMGERILIEVEAEEAEEVA